MDGWLMSQLSVRREFTRLVGLNFRGDLTSPYSLESGNKGEAAVADGNCNVSLG